MNKFVWYIERFKKMNFLEIIHRIKIHLYIKQLKNIDYKKYKYKKKIIFLPLQMPKKDFRSNILADAEQVLENKITIFNTPYNFSHYEKYLYDSIANYKWKKNFFSNINFRVDKLNADPKVIWEVNKQQFLLILADAYNMTEDEKYADKILEEIREWIKQNKVYNSINWCSGLEISLRCINWYLSLSEIAPYLRKRNIQIQEILESLEQQTNFVFNKLSLYSSANNHLIGELTLLLFSSYLLKSDNSNKWRKVSIKLLEKQISNQFYKDGVNKEQSINYQLHTMELYLLCQYLMKKNKSSLSDNTLEILKNACNYINAITNERGETFNIGDDDGGAILKINDANSPSLSILQFGQLILGGEYSKKDYFDEKIYFLFGSEYEKTLKENYNRVKQKPQKDMINFEKGGMYVKHGILSNLKYKFIMDYGDIGLAPLNAHAHSDILGILFSVENQPVLSDMGTYKYHLDNGFRNYFRGVSAHNTISIDNLNHFEFLGNFNCSKSPTTKLLNITNHSIHCLTDSYKKLKCSIERRVEFNDQYIIIEDVVNNNSNLKRTVKIFYNFDRLIKLFTTNQKNKYKIIGNGFELSIQIDEKLNCNIFKGYKDDNTILGFQSTEFYKIEETNVLVCSCEIPPKTSLKFATQIVIK